MRWNLQRDTKKTRAVVHIHATHIVAAIYAGCDLQAISAEFPETSRYTRMGPTGPALSHELADGTAECFGLGKDGSLAFDIVGQANHSVCAVATDPRAAYEHIERLDHICEIVLKSGITKFMHLKRSAAA
jgi:L-fuculose-phosphate aldolase